MPYPVRSKCSLSARIHSKFPEIKSHAWQSNKAAYVYVFVTHIGCAHIENETRFERAVVSGNKNENSRNGTIELSRQNGKMTKGISQALVLAKLA